MLPAELLCINVTASVSFIFYYAINIIIINIISDHNNNNNILALVEVFLQLSVDQLQSYCNSALNFQT